MSNGGGPSKLRRGRAPTDLIGEVDDGVSYFGRADVVPIADAERPASDD